MKRPYCDDKKVNVYINLLEAKLKRYDDEKERAALLVAVLKQISEITEFLYAEKAAEKIEGSIIINEDIVDLLKDISKITDQAEKLKKDLDGDLIERAESQLKQGSSKKGDYSPEEMAEKMRKIKSSGDK